MRTHYEDRMRHTHCEDRMRRTHCERRKGRRTHYEDRRTRNHREDRMRTHCEEMKYHGKEAVDSPQRQKKDST